MIIAVSTRTNPPPLVTSAPTTAPSSTMTSTNCVMNQMSAPASATIASVTTLLISRSFGQALLGSPGSPDVPPAASIRS